MKTAIKTMLGILLTLSITVGCKKESIKGEKGDIGATGATGSANVISSNTILINNFFYYSSLKEYQASLSLPAITQEVLDKGVVIMYISDGSGTWYPLPYTDGTTTLNYQFKLGGFTIIYFNNNGSMPTNPNNLIKIRVVVIPPAIVKANPNANWKDYNSTMSLMNLKN